MKLSLTDYSLPGTYIGTVNAPIYVPTAPVVPTPINDTSNDEPVTPTDDTVTSAKMATGEIIMISGGSLIVVLLITLIVVCILG